jgi:hypothetical protein
MDGPFGRLIFAAIFKHFPQQTCHLFRAAQMRALSETMSYIDTQAVMLRLADDYDLLADRAAARASGQGWPGPEE